MTAQHQMKLTADLAAKAAEAGQTLTEYAAERVKNKEGVLATATDLLEQAQQGYATGQEADVPASAAALCMAEAEIAGVITRAEISERLGKVFGFKVSKTTGKQSKTPDGQGEHIRKRLVRFVQADEYLRDGGTCPKFLENVPQHENERILQSVREGEMTLFTAYADWQETRKEYAEDVPKTAFDKVDKILELVAELERDEVRNRIDTDAELAAVYSHLANATARWIPEAE